MKFTQVLEKLYLDTKYLIPLGCFVLCFVFFYLAIPVVHKKQNKLQDIVSSLAITGFLYMVTIYVFKLSRFDYLVDGFNIISKHFALSLSFLTGEISFNFSRFSGLMGLLSRQGFNAMIALASLVVVSLVIVKIILNNINLNEVSDKIRVAFKKVYSFILKIKEKKNYIYQFNNLEKEFCSYLI